MKRKKKRKFSLTLEKLNVHCTAFIILLSRSYCLVLIAYQQFLFITTNSQLSFITRESMNFILSVLIIALVSDLRLKKGSKMYKQSLCTIITQNTRINNTSTVPSGSILPFKTDSWKMIKTYLYKCDQNEHEIELNIYKIAS